MSRPVVLDQRALLVPATPTAAAGVAALGNRGAIVPDTPLGTGGGTVGTLAIMSRDLGRKKFEPYVSQLYSLGAATLIDVQSFAELVAVLLRYQRIGHLILIGHSVPNDFRIGERQLTCSQIATELAGVAGRIGELTFDGCMIGQNPAGLHEIAVRLGCAFVRGWTFWHCLDRWAEFPTGNVDQAAADFAPLAAVAEPYLPRGSAGATWSAAEQVAAFRTSSLNLMAEYFVESYASHLAPNFAVAVREGRVNSAVHLPRSAAESRLVDSSGAQQALELDLGRSRPVFARTIVTPW